MKTSYFRKVLRTSLMIGLLTTTMSGQTWANAPTAMRPNRHAADLTVGAGCEYAAIGAAIAAAQPGDRLLIEGNRTFTENLTITKTLTLRGGYNGCASGSANLTTLDGNDAGRVLTIAGTTVSVTLETLIVTNGSAGVGGGISADGGRVTLEKTKVHNNSGAVGGGIWIGASSVVTLSDDSDVYYNTATRSGGGVQVMGRLVALDTLSDIYENTAGNGGGIAAKGEVILIGSDIEGNIATAADSKGGGIYLEPGSVLTMTGNTWVVEGQAYDGAGIYADNATIFMADVNAIIRDNIATHNGGGLYLAGGSYFRAETGCVGDDAAGVANEAQWGAGIYAVNSDIEFNGKIINNIAAEGGGGLYAANSSIHMTNAQIGGEIGMHEANQLETDGHLGAGLYFSNTHATLIDTMVAGNAFATTGDAFGGGLYVTGGSAVTLTGSTVEQHLTPPVANGRGAGIFVDGSAITLDNSQVLSNTASAFGGGLFLTDNTMLNVRNGSSINANTAAIDGGGIYAAGWVTLHMSETTLSRNYAAQKGGAIYLNESALDAVNCRFHDGQAGNDGGAIATSASTVTLDSDYSVCDPLAGPCSALYNNIADSDADNNGDGGALFIEGSALQMNHTILHHNQAESGGAIAQIGTDAVSQIHNSLFYSNTAISAPGAGIRAGGGAVTITHSTFADHRGGAAYSQENTNTAIHTSIAWGNTGGFLGAFVTTTCNLDQSGNAGIALDPLFAAPGAGEDYHLQWNSPAIDRCETGETPDLDNVARPIGARYDAGAYEYPHGLTLTPNQSQGAIAPADVVYRHTLHNTGAAGDFYTLTARSGHGWSVTLEPSSPVWAEGGQSIPVTLTLVVPDGVVSGTLDTTVLTATATNAPDLTVTVTDTTFVYTGAAPRRTLTTHVNGQGSVTRTPSQTTYISGTTVQLTAIPTAGWTFEGWSGDLSGSVNPNDVMLNSDKTVTATFSGGCVEIAGASLTYTPSAPLSGEAIVFTGGSSAGANPVYTWNFGDNSAVQAGNPITHTFPPALTPITHTVTLTVSNSCPSQTTTNQSVAVRPRNLYLPVTLRNF